MWGGVTGLDMRQLIKSTQGDSFYKDIIDTVREPFLALDSNTNIRLQRLRELLAASIENRGLLAKNLQEIFNSLDEIEKENEELLRMNEVLITSC